MDRTNLLPCQYAPSFFPILVLLPLLIFTFLTFLVLFSLFLTISFFVFPLRFMLAPGPVCTS